MNPQETDGYPLHLLILFEILDVEPLYPLLSYFTQASFKLPTHKMLKQFS